MADVTPVQIVMANRSRTPTHDELAGQVTALARAVASLGQQVDWNGVVSQSNVSAIGGRLPAPGLSGPSRTLDSPFQVSQSSPALVVYTIELAVSATLLGAQNVAVNLLVDSQNPPVQQLGSVYQAASQTAGLTLTVNQIDRKQLIGWIPAGYWANLQTVASNGTAVLTGQLEVIFGA